MTPTMVAFMAAVIVAASVVRLVFARLNFRSAGIVAGLVIGVLFGPAILGRVAPQWYEKSIIGGAEARQTLEDARQRHAANHAARSTLATDASAARQEHLAELEREQELEAAWRSAQRAHQQGLMIATAGLAGLYFIVVGCVSPRLTGRRADWYSVVSIGLWAAIFPSAIFVAVATWLGVPLVATIAGASGLAIGPAAIERDDLRTADDAEHGGAGLIRGAARVATIVSVVALAWAIIRQGMNPPQSIVCLGVLFTPFIGWLISRTDGPWPHTFIRGVLIPGMTGLVMVRVEVLASFGFWITLTVVLLAGDGRWLGGYLGAMLTGARESLQTMRLILAAMGAGAAQVALAAIAFSADVIDDQLALALVLGAMFMELSTRTRRRLARELEQTEQETTNDH